MNLDRLVVRGLPPWQPSPEASDVEAWHVYDHPMIGTFRASGQRVLYTLVGDAAETVSVWAYVPLTDAESEASAAAEFDSPAEMLDFAQQMFDGKEAVFVAARHLAVWLWTRRHVSPDGGLLATATAALAEIARVVDAKRSPEALFRAELAHVEVAAEELADV